jgi:hypothetical protein
VQTYADTEALIDDPRVLARGTVDNGEPLIDITTVPAVAVDMSRTGVQQLSSNPFQVRSGVADRLAQAQACLPDGYQLQVKEAWRPIWVQERLWKQSLDQLRTSRPGLIGRNSAGRTPALPHRPTARRRTAPEALSTSFSFTTANMPTWDGDSMSPATAHVPPIESRTRPDATVTFSRTLWTRPGSSTTRPSGGTGLSETAIGPFRLPMNPRIMDHCEPSGSGMMPTSQQYELGTVIGWRRQLTRPS